MGAAEFEMNGSKIVAMEPGQAFTLGDLEIFPYRVPHDAADPVAFHLTCAGVKVAQLTDVGYLPDDVAGRLRGSHVLIMESNHDLEMLRVGPYPWNLKQRLMGRFGHLSNTAVGRFLQDQFDGDAEHILLAHLSSQNNHPELARYEAARALRSRGFAAERLEITSQDEPTAPLRL
jgi:phosphoribosyl 1,2-cyclic phosphodiesterase